MKRARSPFGDRALSPLIARRGFEPPPLAGPRVETRCAAIAPLRADRRSVTSPAAYCGGGNRTHRTLVMSQVTRLASSPRPESYHEFNLASIAFRPPPACSGGKRRPRFRRMALGVGRIISASIRSCIALPPFRPRGETDILARRRPTYSPGGETRWA